MSLADDSLALQLMNQLMGGSQGISLGAILLLIRCLGSNWHLLLFTLQQSYEEGMF